MHGPAGADANERTSTDSAFELARTRVDPGREVRTRPGREVEGCEVPSGTAPLTDQDDAVVLPEGGVVQMSAPP